MITGCKLRKDDDFMEAYQILFKSMISIILYVIVSRLYVMQAIGLFARFQYAPKETHVQAIKRICRYLKGTLGIGLWYPRGEEFTLTTYTDADWVGSVDDRKSTSGGAFLLGHYLVSWLSKKWSLISLSTVEVEYIVATSCCKQVLWMKQILQDIKVEYKYPISLMRGNTNDINISNNHV